MKDFLKNKERIIILILTLWGIFITIAFISNKITANKNLDRIIYNAKKEAEQTLVSSGLLTYTKDIENNVGATSITSNENLPENTNTTPQGTVVLPKENWNIETVTAVSVGNGDTVPVPKGFYYVGGDLSTGVIISDDKADEYDGETDKTTYEYTTSLKGNQFVWIPCTEEEYKKCEVWNGITQKASGTDSPEGTLCIGSWDKTTYDSELPQIRKYEGYYVGRYEAGLSTAITEFTSTQQHTLSNQVYNIDKVSGVATKPQSRAGQIPWNFIDWNYSKTNARNMYDTVSVSSGLITGTQWDVMLNKMVEKGAIQGSDLTNSEKWGNYKNNSIEYTGRMASAWVSNGYWYQGVFGGTTTSKTTNYGSGSEEKNAEILTTGASKQTEVYHIYDVAGNLHEWTDECSLYKAKTANETNVQFRIFRGGSFGHVSSKYPACYRYGYNYPATTTQFNTGFRVVLYVK